jgi:hypothetical protein
LRLKNIVTKDFCGIPQISAAKIHIFFEIEVKNYENMSRWLETDGILCRSLLWFLRDIKRNSEDV